MSSEELTLHPVPSHSEEGSFINKDLSDNVEDISSGSTANGYGMGPLACIVTSYVASNGWISPSNAALGPVALDEVRKLHIQEYKALGSTILIIAVIPILITAPVGAIPITLLVPRLLEKEDIIDYEHTNL